MHEDKKCEAPGCQRQAVPTGNIRKKDGLKTRQRYCYHHKKVFYNIVGFEYVKYKKDYCENVDGRLGFKCTATIIDGCQLQVDPGNGNHYDNSKDNCQTLCSNCHSYKTMMSGDNTNRYQNVK